MDFPFNNSGQRHMFSSANQTTRPGTGAQNMMHPTGVHGHVMQRYPNSPYGNQQPFMQQPYHSQSQHFPPYQMGPAQGAPRLQVQPQMIMQPQMLEQQKKLAEKHQKQNEELTIKRNFEAQQRKLQAFKGKSGAKSNPLNELFGKKDGKSDVSGLIGSLGSSSAQKSSAKTSVFSRPGGSHSHVPSTSHMSHPPGPSVTDQNVPLHAHFPPPLQGSQISSDVYGNEAFHNQGIKHGSFGNLKGIGDSEFGDFKGSLSEHNDNVFSNFQEATFPEVRTQTSSTGAYLATEKKTVGILGDQRVPSSTQSRAGSFSSLQGVPYPTQGRSSSFLGQTNIHSTGAPLSSTHVVGGASGHGSFSSHHNHGSTSGFSGSVQGISEGKNILGFDNSVNYPHPVLQGSDMSPISSVKPLSGNAASMDDPGAAENFATSSLSISTNAGTAHVKEEDELEDAEPEDPLKAMYGLELPDWITSGTDLPGVYKDVVAKCTSGTDMIDTNNLYPILLTSELPRDTLGAIWNTANHAMPGQLNHLELRIVLGLVALAQAGIKAEKLTLEKLASCKAAPIPTFPEEILKKIGEGWSFSEQHTSSQETFQRSRYDLGSTSSLSSDASGSVVDSNDRYGAFRMPDHSVTSTSAAVSSDFVLQTQNTGPSITLAGQNSNQLNNTQWNLPSGHMNSAQPAQWNLNSEDKSTNELSNPQLNVSSGKRSTPQYQNKQWNLPSHGLQELVKGADNKSVSAPSQSGFEGFHSVASQSTMEDDFGDFSDFQNKTTNDAISPSVTDVCSLVVSTTPASVVSSSTLSSNYSLLDLNATKQHPLKTIEDDFGSFQDSSAPQGTTLRELATQFNSLNSNTASKKLQENSTNKENPGNNLLDDLFSNVSSKEKSVIQDSSINSKTTGYFPSIPEASFSLSQSQYMPPAETSDKYDIFRTLNLEKDESIFGRKGRDSQTDSVISNTQFNNDSFGEFEEFQKHENKVGPAEGDFGEFSTFEAQSTSKETSTDLFGDFTSSSEDTKIEKFGSGEKQHLPAGLGLGKNAFDSSNNSTTIFSDFGSFSEGVTEKSEATSGLDMWNVNNLDRKTGSSNVSSGNGNFATFGSFSSAPVSEGSGLSNFKPIKDIASVPLEPSQRYKALSAEFEDVDKQVSVWGQCLNSCLLTMTTTSLLIEKMVAESVEDEILKSKEGSKYFMAVVEVYRVTRRIRASIQKSAPNNAKLKVILEETEKTWNNIANLLSGSEIMPQLNTLEFSTCHVTSEEDSSLACGVCLLDVNKTHSGAGKNADAHLVHAGRKYHSTCANFWCNRVDSVLPSLLPVCGLI